MKKLIINLLQKILTNLISDISFAKQGKNIVYQIFYLDEKLEELVVLRDKDKNAIEFSTKTDAKRFCLEQKDPENFGFTKIKATFYF